MQPTHLANTHEGRVSVMQAFHLRVSSVESRLAGAPQPSLTLLDVPFGARVSDGKYGVTLAQVGGSVDISRWKLDCLVLEVPRQASLPSALRLMKVSQVEGKQQREISKVSLQAIVPQHLRGIYLQGLPLGAVLSDGLHTLTSQSELTLLDLTGWHLDALSVQPPRGRHDTLQIRIHVGALNEEERVQLGALKLRLITPNAYVMSDKAVTTPQPSLPKMDIVVGRLAAEHPHSQVRIQSASGPASAASIATDMHAQMQGFKVLDDDELTALEKKMRG